VLEIVRFAALVAASHMRYESSGSEALRTHLIIQSPASPSNR
jgi:hypothetical protein